MTNPYLPTRVLRLYRITSRDGEREVREAYDTSQALVGHPPGSAISIEVLVSVRVLSREVRKDWLRIGPALGGSV